MALVIAVVGVATAAPAMFSLVPRVRLVEAITLFATAFGAGAGLGIAVAAAKRERTT